MLTRAGPAATRRRKRVALRTALAGTSGVVAALMRHVFTWAYAAYPIGPGSLLLKADCARGCNAMNIGLGCKLRALRRARAAARSGARARHGGHARAAAARGLGRAHTASLKAWRAVWAWRPRLRYRHQAAPTQRRDPQGLGAGPRRAGGPYRRHARAAAARRARGARGHGRRGGRRGGRGVPGRGGPGA
jgi:hypothetical protein